MVIKNGIHFEELFNAAAHCALYIYTHRFDPMLLEGVGEGDTFSFFIFGSRFCGPHSSDDAPDRLAAVQQSVK